MRPEGNAVANAVSELQSHPLIENAEDARHGGVNGISVKYDRSVDSFQEAKEIAQQALRGVVPAVTVKRFSEMTGHGARQRTLLVELAQRHAKGKRGRRGRDDRSTDITGGL
jgi:hypothetical protein